jgi:oxygen-independent coproporphyrinogen III oxidase
MLMAIDVGLIQKYNKPGPRYTSYPPATFFHDRIDSGNYKKMIGISNEKEPRNISIYIHIPFCRQFCHFCGCNTSHFPEKEFINDYINAVITEIRSVSSLLDTSRPLTQVHWGGGTPNSIDLMLVEKVMDQIFSIFSASGNAEIAMECNPAWLEPAQIDRLAGMGFNRLSLGIQDFNDEVLHLVNRKPSLFPVEELTARMDANGMTGSNIDLIYGLPGQTAASFRKTIEKAIQISPARLVTFSYAHVPWVKPAQKGLEEIGLPSVEEKLEMFETAYNLLTENGYVAIGMDHYAKPDDELSKALANKGLHRNFQGYCTQDTTGQVYGFGSTSISQLNGGYYQNIKDGGKYIDSIRKSGFAVWKGYELSQDDIIIREIINRIMCNGYMDMNEIAREFGINTKKLKSITGFRKEKLNPFIDDGLLTFDNDTLRLEPGGFMVVRNIAMEFDPLHGDGEGQYSKTV